MTTEADRQREQRAELGHGDAPCPECGSPLRTYYPRCEDCTLRDTRGLVWRRSPLHEGTIFTRPSAC